MSWWGCGLCRRRPSQAIDNVISSFAEPLVDKRRDEGTKLLPQIGIYLQNQAAHIQVRVWVCG